MTTTVETAPPQKGRRRRFSQLSRGDKAALTVFTGIPTLLHIAFIWVPAIATIVLSFTKWNGFFIDEIAWVGLENYKNIFQVFEKNFYRATINNGALMVFLFFGPTMFGIFLAYLLDKNIRGGVIYQSVFYTPVVLSLAVVGFIWKSVIYSPGNGILNTMLGRTADGNQIDWLGDQTFLIGFTENYGITKNFAAILVAVGWTHVGYIMVLYLAGLKSVDPALREAAEIDGCNEWQAFRRVVFPAMKPVNVVITVITMIQALRAFDIIFALNNPRGTDVLAILVTDNLLGAAQNVGRGSAYAALLLLMCIGFIIWYVFNSFRSDAV